jgi:hypothetical protein
MKLCVKQFFPYTLHLYSRRKCGDVNCAGSIYGPVSAFNLQSKVSYNPGLIRQHPDDSAGGSLYSTSTHTERIVSHIASRAVSLQLSHKKNTLLRHKRQLPSSSCNICSGSSSPRSPPSVTPTEQRTALQIIISSAGTDVHHQQKSPQMFPRNVTLR